MVTIKNKLSSCFLIFKLEKILIFERNSFIMNLFTFLNEVVTNLIKYFVRIQILFVKFIVIIITFLNFLNIHLFPFFVKIILHSKLFKI